LLNNIFFSLDDEAKSTGDGEEDDCEEHEVVSSRGARHDSPEPMARSNVRHDSPEAGALGKVCTDSPDAASLRRTRHDSPDVSPRRHPGKQKAHSRGDASQYTMLNWGCDSILYDFNKLVRYPFEKCLCQMGSRSDEQLSGKSKDGHACMHTKIPLIVVG